MRQKRATTSKYTRSKTRTVPEAPRSRNQGKENGGQQSEAKEKMASRKGPMVEKGTPTGWPADRRRRNEEDVRPLLSSAKEA